MLIFENFVLKILEPRFEHDFVNHWIHHNTGLYVSLGEVWFVTTENKGTKSLDIYDGKYCPS